MTAEELIDNLKRLDTGYDLNDWGYHVVYDWTREFVDEHEEYSKLEDLFDEFLDAEVAESYVQDAMGQSGLLRVKQITEEIDFDAGVYRLDDVFGSLYNIYQEDVDELISNIIDALKEEKVK